MDKQVQENKVMDLQDVGAKSFASTDLNAAQNYISKVVDACTEANIEPVFNFDTNEELPEGYGLSILPLTERVAGQGNVTKGVCIAAVPSVDSILAATGGDVWVRKQINTLLVRAIKAGATPSDDGSITSIPFSIADFTASRVSALAAFNAIAPLYVKALKDKGLKFINKGLLRQVLASAAFAEQQFPRIDQANWELVIKSMTQAAAKENLEAGILAHWSKTRNEVEVDTSDIDLSDIENILKGDSKDVDTGDEKVTSDLPDAVMAST